MLCDQASFAGNATQPAYSDAIRWMALPAARNCAMDRLLLVIFPSTALNQRDGQHSKAVNLFDDPFANEFGVVESLGLRDFMDDHCVF